MATTVVTTGRSLCRYGHVWARQVTFRPLSTSSPCACYSSDTLSDKKQKRRKKLYHSYKYLPIEGVPPIILKLIPSYYSFQKPFSYNGEAIHAAGDRDAVHLTSFTNSAVLSELCRRLHVPYDFVSGFSAPLALKRFCDSRKIGEDIVGNEDFVTREVLKDIFMSVQNEAVAIANETLLTLIFHHYAHTGFDEKCFDALSSEFKRRLAEKLFSVDELCTVSAMLCKCSYTITGLPDLFTRIWAHICSRLSELKADSLSDYYRAVPKPLAYEIYNKLETSLTNHLHSLDFRNIFLISKEVQLKAPRSKRELLKVSLWAKKAEKQISDSEIMSLLNDFQTSSFVDSLFLSVLSEYIMTAHKNQKLRVDLIAAALPYYCLAKYYSEILLETVCEFYITTEASISNDNLATILQAVGTFCYVPKRHRMFFSKVEGVLMTQFYKLDSVRLMEMVRHLIYVNRVPIHLKSCIFHPFFQGLLKDASERDYDQAVLDLHLYKTALSVCGINMDQAFYPRPELKIFWNRLKVIEKGDKILVKIYQGVLDILQDPATFTALARFTFNNVYYKVGLDVNNCVVPLNNSACCKHIVIMVILDSSFTKNCPERMLGEDTTNIRLLEKTGLSVVAVPFRMYMSMDDMKTSLKESLYDLGISINSSRGQASNGV